MIIAWKNPTFCTKGYVAGFLSCFLGIITSLIAKKYAFKWVHGSRHIDCSSYSVTQICISFVMPINLKLSNDYFDPFLHLVSCLFTKQTYAILKLLLFKQNPNLQRHLKLLKPISHFFKRLCAYFKRRKSFCIPLFITSHFFQVFKCVELLILRDQIMILTVEKTISIQIMT